MQYLLFDIFYSLNKGFEFQSYVCYRCHDLLMMPMNLADIAILNIKGAGYCYVISRISKKRGHKLNAKY